MKPSWWMVKSETSFTVLFFGLWWNWLISYERSKPCEAWLWARNL